MDGLIFLDVLQRRLERLLGTLRINWDKIQVKFSY
ncbi:hypothetical protein PAECIP111891_05207 [Paenibacillus allorhizoplanae]|uniref:Uncharacterized protein n=1 Tax=Paenibacillus allorhizoplanae TaxID=2905648 RepID=A0ABN8GXJ7_9BACL|nr:hypothetical protein PAECIP111891_05207 [Paenibacillus allorhizoplanae]